MGGLSKLYLLSYNSLQAIGWAVSSFQILCNLLSTSSVAGAYSSAGKLIRYTAFIVLYPLGVGPGEIWIMYRALPIVKKKNLYSETFSGLPFSYYDFLKVVLIIYPFLWLKLYLHLFRQRRSKLFKRQDKKRA